MENILIIINSLIGLFAIIWIIQCSVFFLYKVFASKYEKVGRETFEQSKAYQHGTNQELQKGDIKSVYVEHKIIVSPFKLK